MATVTEITCTLKMSDTDAERLSDVLCYYLVGRSQAEDRSVTDLWTNDEDAKLAQRIRKELIDQYIR